MIESNLNQPFERIRINVRRWVAPHRGQVRVLIFERIKINVRRWVLTVTVSIENHSTVQYLTIL